jgi:hypothetical protein
MNRFTLIFISFFLISQTVISQKEVEFLPSDWENQAVFEKGQTHLMLFTFHTFQQMTR